MWCYNNRNAHNYVSRSILLVVTFNNNWVTWLVFAQATRTTKRCRRKGTLAGNWRGATRSEAVRRRDACRLRFTGAVRWDTYQTNTERTNTGSTPHHRRRVSSVLKFRDIDNNNDCAPAKIFFFFFCSYVWSVLFSRREISGHLLETVRQPPPVELQVPKIIVRR